jgi:excisionase family DNA binding protein
MASTGAYLTLLEAARLLRVEPRTLARWARDGHVPALKTPGGQWRFVREDLLLALRHVGTGGGGQR